MEDSTPPFNPSDLQLSKLRFYSLGIVAANKPLGTTIIEVTPTEEVSTLDGEIDDAITNLSFEGVGADDKSYSVNVDTAVSIKADWLRLGYGNRRTAPDVRRGAQVIIYQFGDLNKFYWTTLRDDFKLRKLETVIYAWTGTKDEGVENNSGNTYFLEISTHTGVVTFHTSDANGEFCKYDIQINAKEGRVVITDSIGNYFVLDSKEHQLRMENVDGSIMDITKQICTITTLSEINLKTKHFTLNAEKGDMHIQDFNIDGSTLDCTTSAVSYNNSSFTVSSGNTDIS